MSDVRPDSRDYDDCIAAARAQGPSEGDLARLASRLGIEAAPCVGIDAAARVAVPARRGGWWFAARVTVAIIAVGAFLMNHHASSPAPSSPAPSSPAASSPSAPSPAPSSPAASSSAAPSPPASSARSMVVETVSEVHGGSPPPRVGETHDARAPIERSAARSERPLRWAPAPEQGRGIDEIALIDAAEAALHEDPRRALQLARRHARAFPHGSFAQEREVLAIDALSRLGQLERARERALRFRALHPRSAYLRRIDRIVGGVTNAVATGASDED